MSALTIRKGRQHRATKLCVYGVPGVGKTTFGANAPEPLVWCLESGAEQIDVDKLDAPASWSNAIETLQMLQTEQHQYSTLVVDTLDALEALAVRSVCEAGKKETLADFDWGKGPLAVSDRWRVFLKMLEQLQSTRGMNIVLLAHENRKNVKDPVLGEFMIYQPKLIDRVWSLTNEWCDAVFFAEFETAAHKAKGQNMERMMVTGSRVLRTTRGTGYVAKNRFSLPGTIPLDWGAFEAAVSPGAGTEAILRGELVSALAELNDPRVATAAQAHVEKSGGSLDAIRQAINTVRAYLAERA